MKRFAFVVLGPVVLLGLLELLLRAAGVEPDPIWFRVTRYTDGRMRVEVPAPGSTLWGDATFPEAKPPGTYRIAFLGASTTYGVPFGPHCTIPKLVERRLKAMFPERTFEAINFGTPTESMKATRRLLPLALAVDADLVVLETGHNEFLPQHLADTDRGAVGALRERIADTRIGRLLFRLLGRTGTEHGVQDEAGLRAGVFKPRSDPLVFEPEAQELRDRRDRVEADFIGELERFYALAHDAGVPVITIVPPTDVAEYWPERSAATGPPDELRAQVAKMEDCVFRMTQSEASMLPVGLAAAEAALAIAPDLAIARHRRGTFLQLQRRVPEAGAALDAAANADLEPMGATPRLKQAMRKASVAAGVAIADVEATFRAAAPDGIICVPMLVDYCHPSLDGQYRFASVVLDALRLSGLLIAPAQWPKARDLRQEVVLDAVLAEAGVRSRSAEPPEGHAAFADLRFALVSFSPRLYAGRAASRLAKHSDLMPDPAIAHAACGIAWLLADDADGARREIERALEVAGAGRSRVMDFLALMADSSERARERMAAAGIEVPLRAK